MQSSTNVSTPHTPSPASEHTSTALPLWETDAPGALGSQPQDIPTITPYLPDAATATGAAIVVCPGGGYGMLAPHEGHDFALWLNQQGVTAFVLHYRLGSHGYRHPAMLTDAARALRTVRANASRWNIDPDRIGVMGSSAGGHLAATLLTHFDAGDPTATDPIEQVSSRPDLGILCYAVLSMGPLGHAGSRSNLLGAQPSPDLITHLSNELQVTPHTPPCFLWHTVADDAVPVENSMMFAAALRRNRVPFALHIYEDGVHGLGLNDTPPFSNAHAWSHNLLVWLRLHSFVA